MGVTSGMQGVGANAPPNFLSKNSFFWLLSKRGANKTTEIFSERLFGWCRQNK